MTFYARPGGPGNGRAVKAIQRHGSPSHSTCLIIWISAADCDGVTRTRLPGVTVAVTSESMINRDDRRAVQVTVTTTGPG